MKPAARKFHSTARGLTLLEMTIVISVILTFAGVSLVVNKKFGDWKLGREAAETLRTVYSAQRMYLSDNPTVSVANINNALLLPYMPKKGDGTVPAAMPTVKSLTGTNLSFQVSVSPPIITNGGTLYDPSSSRTDNLWDVGE